MTDNVNLTETWTPQDGVVLCLNGKTITMNADDKAVIEVDSNNSFTLCDCKGEVRSHMVLSRMARINTVAVV